jgi:hypothetical protein
MKVLWIDGLLKTWEKLTRTLIHPKNPMGQWFALVIDWNKSLTLVRDGQGL